MIHPTSFVGEGCDLPPDADIREFCILRGGITVGRNVTIYAYSNIAHGTIIEDHVYIGPGVITTNTKRVWHRRPKMPMHPRKPVTIKYGARIGAGVIILPGVVIGEQSFIGAGSVVTKDTKPFHMYWGNPARDKGRIPDEEIL
jgi:acetyltransferase-like isoleucine patch superfamily enzyme